VRTSGGSQFREDLGGVPLQQGLRVLPAVKRGPTVARGP
jgi:hypothetical protein